MLQAFFRTTLLGPCIIGCKFSGDDSSIIPLGTELYTHQVHLIELGCTSVLLPRSTYSFICTSGLIVRVQVHMLAVLEE